MGATGGVIDGEPVKAFVLVLTFLRAYRPVSSSQKWWLSLLYFLRNITHTDYVPVKISNKFSR